MIFRCNIIWMTATKPTNSNVIIFAYDIYIYIDEEWKRIGVEAVMNIIHVMLIRRNLKLR